MFFQSQKIIFFAVTRALDENDRGCCCSWGQTGVLFQLGFVVFTSPWGLQHITVQQKGWKHNLVWKCWQSKGAFKCLWRFQRTQFKAGCRFHNSQCEHCERQLVWCETEDVSLLRLYLSDSDQLTRENSDLFSHQMNCWNTDSQIIRKVLNKYFVG